MLRAMRVQVERDSLPGTDEFILRCERIRAWNYAARADAQRSVEAGEPSGAELLEGAQVWFSGKQARVHWLDCVNVAVVAQCEAWLAERGLEAQFDVVPTQSSRPAVVELADRGYRLVDWLPALYIDLSRPLPVESDALRVEEVGSAIPEFVQTFLAGHELPEAQWPTGAVLWGSRWRAEGAVCFVAYRGAQPVGVATVVLHDGFARLANSATLPAARNTGVQSALIRARLRYCASRGLRFVVADAQQGSASSRNLSRAGFAVSARITQWRKPASST
jgi:GNAT superfamily N-acetyltransferase